MLCVGIRGIGRPNSAETVLVSSKIDIGVRERNQESLKTIGQSG